MLLALALKSPIGDHEASAARVRASRNILNGGGVPHRDLYPPLACCQLSAGDSADSIASANVVAAKGFIRKAAAPNLIARSRSIGFSFAVIKMIGVAADPTRVCRRSETRKPSPAGSEMSNTT